MRVVVRDIITVLIVLGVVLLSYCFGSLGSYMDKIQVATAAEPETEVAQVPIFTLEDYNEMSVLCYNYLKEHTIGVYSVENYDYADGSATNYSDFVYVDDTIFIHGRLFMRFVGDASNVLCLISDGTDVYPSQDFYLLGSMEDAAVARYENVTNALLLGVHVDETDSLFNPSCRRILNWGDKVKDTKVVFSAMGKTDINMEYDNRVIVQCATDEGYVTVMYYIDSDGTIFNIDII